MHIHGIYKDSNNDPIFKIAEETQIEPTDFLHYVREGEGRIVWENSTETCILPYVKQMTSTGSMHEAGYSKHVLWYDPEGWGGERSGRGIQDGGTHLHLWLIHGKTPTIL